MSKEIYIVNCYTCQHNGQETCKGCNTLLNGDVEPYENWELREDLSQKDQRIAELEQDLKFTTKTANELIEIKHKLEQELAELKEKAIVPRFKFDEECVVIMFGSYHFHRFIAQVKDDLCLTQPYDDTEEWYYVKPEMVFKTLEEAQAKLKEIQGNE